MSVCAGNSKNDPVFAGAPQVICAFTRNAGDLSETSDLFETPCAKNQSQYLNTVHHKQSACRRTGTS